MSCNKLTQKSRLTVGKLNVDLPLSLSLSLSLNLRVMHKHFLVSPHISHSIKDITDELDKVWYSWEVLLHPAHELILH